MDVERPSARLRAARGREQTAQRASEALETLLRATRGDSRMRAEVVRALIRAGVVEVERGVE